MQRNAARSSLSLYSPVCRQSHSDTNTFQSLSFLNKPAQHWKCILHTEGCHQRNSGLQLQNMAAPTSHCSCVCMYLGFTPATHFPEHWTILQRTIVSFCLNYPVENNQKIRLRHINAAGCSNAWILYIAISVSGQRSHQTGIVLSSSHSCA